MSPFSITGGLVALLAGLFAQPAQIQPENAQVAVCFAPESQCAKAAIDSLNAARQSIRAHLYRASTSAGFTEALIRAKRRGLDVEAIADKSAPCWGSGVPLMVSAGIPVWIDDRVTEAHEKAFIVDSHLVVTGSYNATVTAATNSEDMNFIDSPRIAELYLVHWQTRQTQSERYVGWDRWCRTMQTGAR